MSQINLLELKNRLESLQGFVLSHTETAHSADQLDNIAYLSQAIDFVAANGEEVNQEQANTETQLDFEIAQKRPFEFNYSCTPTFIIGYRRSGTTLLSSLMNSHSKFASIPENYLGSELAESTSLHLISQISFALGTHPSLYWAYLSKMIDEIYLRFLEEHGIQKPRWFAKEFRGGAQLQKLDYIFGHQPKYIFLTRHGLDVAHSCAERYPERGDFDHQGRLLHGYLAEWIEASEYSKDLCELYPERCLQLKYEDLVADPASTMQQVFEFLDESHEPEIFERVKRQEHVGVSGDHKIHSTGYEVNANSVNKWSQWPEPLKQQLLRKATATLERLGY